MVKNQKYYRNKIKLIEKDMRRFVSTYKFGLEEVKTKINILNEEFEYIHDHNPIDHVKTRMKTVESILNKAHKKGLDFTPESIKNNIRDIAGMRIVCSFVSDIYLVAQMIENLENIEIVDYKDYIKNPKPNGYQSLHLILKVPVYLSDRVEETFVEVQIRTIGMEFWASLEHKIYYKYDGEIPEKLKDELMKTALVVSELDKNMEVLNREVTNIKTS